MAATIVKRSAERQRGVESPAIRRHAARISEPSRVKSVCELAVVAVIVVVNRILSVELEAFEIRIDDEVDNASHSVGTVHRGSTARKHVNTLEHGGRDYVDVSSRRRRVTRDETTAVDENERPLGAETAKVQSGRTRRAVGDVRALTCENLRKRVDEIFDAGRTGLSDFCRRNDCDRACRFKIGLTDTRAGNDDYLISHNVFCRIDAFSRKDPCVLVRICGLRKRRLGNHRDPKCKRRGTTLQILLKFHVSSIPLQGEGAKRPNLFANRANDAMRAARPA